MAGGDSVQQIKERLSILDVISPYVELHKAGKSYKGKSPFTNEKTPSFYVSPERGMYYCFSSSQGGDMFTFIEKMEGVDFKGALKILAEKAGVELVPEDPKKRSARDRQYALIEEATAYFFKERETQPAPETYVEERGVSGHSIHLWRIGYAPDEWRALRSHLTGKGYTDAEMLAAGLVKRADGGKEPYDVFRDRVMFPICDPSGRVVAFSGRTLKKDPETPKYVNSPETELFNKSEILFGYDKAKEGIRKLDFSLIVEGQFDVVLAHQAGYGNAVAVSGTALTAHHVMLLERLSSRIVLSLDADRAGVAAVMRAANLMLRRGLDVKVAELPEGKDPADMVREGKDAFKKVIGHAKHVIPFLLEIMRRGAKDERSFKLRAREEIVPLLAVMPNHIDREHFEDAVALASGTTKDAIHYEVERVLEKQSREDHTDDAAEAHTVERSAVGRRESLTAYLAVLPTLIEKDDAKELEKTFKDITGTKTAEVRKELDTSRLSELTFTLEAALERMSVRERKEDIEDKLAELKRLTARDALHDVKEAIRQAEREGDHAKVDELMQQSAELHKALG